MSIPLAMSPVGYDTWVTELKRALITYLDSFYLEVDYLPDEKKLVVHTDRVSDETYAEVAEIAAEYMPSGVTLEQYNHHIEYTYDEYMKYSSFTNMSNLRAAYPDYRDDVTPTGVWAYNLDNMSGINQWHDGGWDRLFQNADKIKKLYVNLPKLTYDSNWIVNGCDNLEELEITHYTTGIGATPRTCPKLKRVKLHAPNATSLDSCLANCPLVESWDVVADWENVTKFNYCFKFKAITSWDIPLPKCSEMVWQSFTSSFTSFNVELPALQSGHDAFTACTLDKPSVLRICNSVPSVVLDESDQYGIGRLGLGINIAHQDDAEVLAAIDAATAKGWLVTTRWNTPPTA